MTLRRIALERQTGGRDYFMFNLLDHTKRKTSKTKKSNRPSKHLA